MAALESKRDGILDALAACIRAENWADAGCMAAAIAHIALSEVGVRSQLCIGECVYVSAVDFVTYRRFDHAWLTLHGEIWDVAIVNPKERLYSREGRSKLFKDCPKDFAGELGPDNVARVGLRGYENDSNLVYGVKCVGLATGRDDNGFPNARTVYSGMPFDEFMAGTIPGTQVRGWDRLLGIFEQCELPLKQLNRLRNEYRDTKFTLVADDPGTYKVLGKCVFGKAG